MADLLPCPFCGSDSVRFASARSFHVVCDNCVAFGPTEDKTDSGELWNRRAPVQTSLDHFIDDVEAAEKRDELPEPAFRLTWSGMNARYYVNKPNIDSTDCYTAEQMRQQFNAGREFESERAAMKGDQP